MDTPLIKCDFHKLDVYRFDIQHDKNNLYHVDLTNSISWDSMSLQATREELKGLADFINNYLENN
jgi:hypothetical protein